ncbi:fatty acid--CoA ligase family protein [Nostoc sp. CHAB 5715]|uniref:ANL family adenylate-forming protein n=1 Tax=Nostoc sp. CHAB 5715 TaxID=2780400 RepID=UPI001E5B8683|nr:fatty acid--CoA ligase family protein [Nostoc sp. CHAB 5715]MCC5622297.1 fatty acid--CoA ligase family protein [Nostoc sp. CHAB 5715]
MRYWLLERLDEFEENIAIIWQEQQYTYKQLSEQVVKWQHELSNYDIWAGESVALHGDYSFKTCTLLLALIANRNIVVPLTSLVPEKKAKFLEIARVGAIFEFSNNDTWSFNRRKINDRQPLLDHLRIQGESGLVLFTSGSTGESKAVLLSFDKILEKFKERRPQLRTLAFLLLDHIGGINTLLHILSNGGTVISIDERSPQSVCRAIEQYRVQLLPTTPTFLNMLLISEAYKHYDLSSLELITYGTEPMPISTLEYLNKVLPWVRLKQTYGLSELGIPQTQSRNSNSLWVKVGGEGFETKVVKGNLWIRAKSAMLGYLNAPSPFDEAGWFNTGDAVEVDGEYIRILGRTSEIINVGGEKVYPAEVESVLLQMDNIRDATVRGQANPVTGNVVVATVNLFEPEEPRSIERRMREFCKDRLAAYKIPVFLEISKEKQYSDRFKRMRNKYRAV